MISKFKNMLFMIFLLISSSLFAEELPLISILNFTSSGISELEVKIVTDYISSQIVETDLYHVIDRSERDKILNELKFSLSGCVDETCQLEVGKMLQADEIITGSVGEIGDRIVLNIKLLDVESGTTIKTNSKQYDSINNLIDDSKSFIFEFFIDDIDEKSFSEKVINDKFYEDELEGFYPERFYSWLNESENFDKFLAGDGYIKSQIIDKYKKEELGMRLSASLHLGYHGLFFGPDVGEYPNDTMHNIEYGGIVSFQPFLNFGFGVIASGITNIIYLDNDVNDHENNFYDGKTYWDIGGYLSIGNKIDNFSFGVGASINGFHMSYTANVFYKGYYLKFRYIPDLSFERDYYTGFGVVLGFTL